VGHGPATAVHWAGAGRPLAADPVPSRSVSAGPSASA